MNGDQNFPADHRRFDESANPVIGYLVVAPKGGE
ncbi:hypothetical protein BKA25_004468 [Actinoalloteichus hymeniacidonis]|jgi:hypothetical protein|nr:hypothetical protein [Actinoalloteichus hymeniacidonis]